MNSYRTLVDTEALARHLDDPRWRIFDCRHDLAQPALGAKQYLEGHVPGALFLHLDTDLSGPKNGTNGRHPLPDPQVFIALLGRAGLTRGHQVIAYDAGNGTMAARLWWMLNWVGHESAAVLDGGFAKWVKEGREVTRALPEYPPTAYAGTPAAANVDAAYVEAHLGAGAVLSNLKSLPGHVTVEMDGVPFDTGLRKFGALLGDGAEVGCNAVLNPGSILGRGAVIYPNVFWRGILPANMIAKNKAQIEVVVRRPRETK